MTRRDRARPRIIWDLDDTLNELMRCWLAWAGSSLPFDKVSENPPHRLLNLTLSDYLMSLDRFRLSARGAEMEPRPEVVAWFAEYGFDFEHHVLTARPRTTVAAAAHWVFRHFGRWVRHFHFVPAARPEDPLPDDAAPKHETIARIGGSEFFVDDNPESLENARGCVGKCLLVPQPWNDGRGTFADVLNALTPVRA